MRRSSVFLVAALCALTLAAAGCDGDDDALKSASAYGEPEVTGVVDEIDADGRVLIRSPGDDCGMWFTEQDSTVVVHTFGGVASWSDITVGTPAQGWATGLIRLSCPAQTGAAKIVIGD